MPRHNIVDMRAKWSHTKQVVVTAWANYKNLTQNIGGHVLLGLYCNLGLDNKNTWLSLGNKNSLLALGNKNT